MTVQMCGPTATFLNWMLRACHFGLQEFRPITSARPVSAGEIRYIDGSLEQRGFDWWVSRVRRAHALYDMIRLDHFRGFEAYWAIPADEETAIRGKWIKAPGAALFSKLREVLGELPFIAEDLGLITPEVDQLREDFEMPGMRILQFGFGDKVCAQLSSA